MVQFFEADVLLCISEVAVVGVALWVTAVLAFAHPTHKNIQLHTVGHASGTPFTLVLKQQRAFCVSGGWKREHSCILESYNVLT